MITLLIKKNEIYICDDKVRCLSNINIDPS